MGVVQAERVRARSLSEPAGERDIRQETLDGACDVLRALGVEEEAGDTVLHNRGNAAAGGRRAGQPAGHGLDERLGIALGERRQHEAVGALEVPRQLAVGYDASEVYRDAPLAREPLEVAAQAAVSQDAERERGHLDPRQRLDQPAQILLPLESPRVEDGVRPGSRLRRRRREAVRVDAIGEEGESRLGRVGRQEALHLARCHDHAGRPRKGHALEPAVEQRLEPRACDPGHLGVVIAVGDDERNAVEGARDESRHDAGELLDPKRLALAKLATVDERHEQGVRARGPWPRPGQQHDLVEEERIAGKIGEGFAKVAEVVNAVVALAVVTEVVVQQPLVLARTLEIRQPAAEGGQDADGPGAGHRGRSFPTLGPYTRRSSSTMRSPLNFAVTDSAACRPSVWRRPGSARRSSMARASAAGSLRSTRSPVDLSSTASGVPPILVPITGLAKEAASSGTRLKGSGQTAGWTT